MVNDPDPSWRSILTALLQRQEPEVSGRADIPDDLKSDLKRLAGGKCDERERQKICEKVVGSVESLRLLARMLRDDDESPSNLENP
jgi:hypothetical protein